MSYFAQKFASLSFVGIKTKNEVDEGEIVCHYQNVNIQKHEAAFVVPIGKSR